MLLRFEKDEIENLNYMNRSECSPRPMSERQPSSDDSPEAPWTAVRCDQILQNLRSNINALRELTELEQATRATKRQKKEVTGNAGDGRSSLSGSAKTQLSGDDRKLVQRKRLEEFGNEW